jgi:2Fe-2S ferredoxin
VTIRLNVVDREGQSREIETHPQGSLMEVLRDFDLGVAATCGGMCSCATCHVYVASAWADRLVPPQNDEAELIDGLQYRGDASRLACQISLSEHLDGLTVTIAAEE